MRAGKSKKCIRYARVFINDVAQISSSFFFAERFTIYYLTFTITIVIVFITFFRLMNLAEPNWGLLVWQTRNQLTEQWNVGFWREKCQGRIENSETQFMWLESRFLQYANPSLFFVFYESPVFTHWRATEFPIVPLCPLFSPAGQIEKITSLRTPQLGTASSVFWFILCGSLIIGGFCFK